MTLPVIQPKNREIMLPVAVSIVLSGQYEDDVDKSEEVEYTGEGGNDLLGNKCQVKDQVMCRGNLALKVRNDLLGNINLFILFLFDYMGFCALSW